MTTKKKQQSEAWRWFEYLGEGMDKEPKTTGDMIAMGLKSAFRLFVFTVWMVMKPIRWILRKMFRRGNSKQGVDDMFGRGKKKEQNPYNPDGFERVRFAPPQIPSHMADQQLGYPAHTQPYQPPAYPQQPYPPQSYPPAQPQQQYAQPPLSQPVYDNPQPAPEQQRMVQNPFIELDKSFEQIQDAFSNVHARIMDIERDLDELFNRTNQLMGVQGRPERTIRFRN